MDKQGISTRAELARHLGCSRARVSQVLTVLDVPAFLKKALECAEAQGKGLSEAEWKKIKGLGETEVQTWMRERAGGVG